MKRNPSILLAIQRQLPELNGKSRTVAEAILAAPEQLLCEKAADLAGRCNCDSALVVRLCQKLGFSGFPGLKQQLVSELLSQRSTLERQIAPADNPVEKLKAQFAADFTRTVNDTLSEVDEKVLKKATSLIFGSKCVYLAGCGSSALAAQDLQSKLLRLGYTAIFFADTENLNTLCRTLGASDLLVLISFSGATASMLNLAETAGACQVPVLALTNYPASGLAKRATLTLLTAADEEKLRVGAMTSVISQLLVIDLVISLLAGLDRPRTERRMNAMNPGKMKR